MTAPRKRVRVTSPRTGAARARRVAVTSRIDSRTQVGEIYLRSLMRAQLRLALRVLGVVGVLVGVWPLVFRLAPGVHRVVVLGVPVSWLFLALLVYPLLLAAGAYYVVRAERNERTFVSLAEAPPEGDPR